MKVPFVEPVSATVNDPFSATEIEACIFETLMSSIGRSLPAERPTVIRPPASPVRPFALFPYN